MGYTETGVKSFPVNSSSLPVCWNTSGGICDNPAKVWGLWVHGAHPQGVVEIRAGWFPYCKPCSEEDNAIVKVVSELKIDPNTTLEAEGAELVGERDEALYDDYDPEAGF